MNQKIKLLMVAAVLGLLILAGSARAQTSAFTYQGRLQDGTNAASGIYDLAFTLYDAASGGNSVGATNVVNDQALTNGLFTVTLDFGANAFIGSTRWIQIAVRPGASSGAYTNLTPRQSVTATPYALFAAGANASTLVGSIPSTSLAGTYSVAVTLSNPGNVFTGSGLNLTALNASQLTSGTVPAGVLSNAWKLGGNTGANPTNGIFLGTTDTQPLEFKVNGLRGLRLQYADDGVHHGVSVIGGYGGNIVAGGVVGATISGGGNAELTNRVTGNYGAIGGGDANTASAVSTTVGGGAANTASNVGATVGGGNLNTASGHFATVAGGQANTASGYDAAVPGGNQNIAGGDTSFAAGDRAQANHPGAFVWGDSTDADFASTANDQFLIRASGGVAIGTNNPAGAALRVVGSIKADSFLGMGSTLMLGTTDNQPLEFKVNNQRGLRLEYADNGFFHGVNVIGGYSSNLVAGGVVGATISGGGYAGNSSQVTGDFGTVGGGAHNSAGTYATIGGGGNNSAGTYAVVGGGSLNIASGYAATVPGGSQNTASGDNSFAAGNRAKANHQGAFVWADSTDADFASTANDQFLIRASGGVAIGTTNPAGAALRVAGSISANSFLGANVTGNQTITGSLRVDSDGVNDGGVFGVPALTFGNSVSGEGIASKRTAGGNQFGLDFYTSYNARFSIKNNGNIGIGTTNPASLLEVNGTAAKPGGGAWAVASDVRLKKNIADLHGSLERLLQLRSVSFEYKDPKHGAGPQIGFIAQEVRQVMPQWVIEGSDGMLAVSVTGFESLTVDALRELRAEQEKQIDQLKTENVAMQTRLTHLDDENAALKKRLDRLEQSLADRQLSAAQ